MQSVNQNMSMLLSMFCLFFWANIGVAENLTDEISRYSDKDELVAKEKVLEQCAKSDSADKELLDLSKKINASMDQDIAKRKSLSLDTEKAFKELESFNYKELQKLQSECTNARNNYGVILKVREHAAVEAETIESEQKKQARDNQKQPTTTNCTSNIAGQTVYTSCRSY